MSFCLLKPEVNVNKVQATIIVFSYNQEKYIRDAVISILNQDYCNLRIVFSDDASNDNTFEVISTIVNEYTGKHEVILNRNQVNLGLIAHINKAVEEFFCGEYLLFAAGDDIATPWRVSFSVQEMEQNLHLTSLVMGLLPFEDIAPKIAPEMKKNSYSEISMLEYTRGLRPVCMGSAARIIRRSVIDFFPVLANDCETEDSTYFIRSLLLGNIRYYGCVGTLYRRHEDAMSIDQNLHRFNADKIFNQYYQDIKHALKLHAITSDVGNKIETELKKEYLLRKVSTKNDVANRIKFAVLSKLMVLRKLYNTLRYRVFSFLGKQSALIFGKLLKLSVKDSVLVLLNKADCLMWCNDRENSKNFGDALNPYLFSQFSSKKVVAWKNIFPLKSMNVYVFIGSILDDLSITNSVICGAGFRNENAAIGKINPRVLFVRGPKTREILLKNNIKCPERYCDPALLLPHFYMPQVDKKYKYGIIAHYIDSDELNTIKIIGDESYVTISVKESIECFIRKVCECEYILSSSLHGLIVANAYGIPSSWISLSEKIDGGDFKFLDYYASMGNEIPFKCQVRSELDVVSCGRAATVYDINMLTRNIMTLLETEFANEKE